MRVRIAHALALATLTVSAFAQGPTPRGTASITLKGKKVTIDYGRPSLKGRTLDALVSQLSDDRIWRAGVNQVTTLTTEGDLLIAGKKVPAGKYSVYVYIPKAGDWNLVLNSDPGVENRSKLFWPHLGDYAKVADKEVVRASMKESAASSPAELFTIALAPSKDGAVATLSWGDKAYSVDVQP